jgi:hypothetical protein
VIVTFDVVENAAHPPDAVILYVTVYVPGVLADGVMAPVEALMTNPAGALKTPPVVPVRETACALVREAQNGVPA